MAGRGDHKIIIQYFAKLEVHFRENAKIVVVIAKLDEKKLLYKLRQIKVS